MNTKLTAKEILDKDFKVGLRGYSQEEVDQYLDEIIKDYDTFEKVLQAKEREIELLRQELEQAKARSYTQSPSVRPALSSTATATAGATNYDILKRLANLEKHVFGDKIYE